MSDSDCLGGRSGLGTDELEEVLARILAAAGGEVRLDDEDRLAAARARASRIEVAIVDDLARTTIVRLCPGTCRG